MAKFLSLFSGSSGNSTYVGDGTAGILIDAGKTAKQLAEALRAREIDPAGLSALFITHEHGDHAQGLRVFSSKFNVPVYATEGTIKGLKKRGYIDEKTQIYPLKREMEIEGLKITPFPVSHDTYEPCGYSVFTADERKFTICTDTGVLTEQSRQALSGSNVVILESNHELSMLLNGPYPYPLKMRVSGAKGHLSNDDCARELVRLVQGGTTGLYLGHLSRENNTPEIAEQSALSALQIAGLKRGFDFELGILPPVNNKKAVIF
ncbi:MAG: MBL fold metallo-hydrolase [Clostridia bacterium]|nr:MBL fold metallo-hydrolase [Clostridia bacterium]